MASGDVKSDLQSIGTNSFMNIQPASGEEWCIHNIHHGADVEVYFYDGTNQIKIMSDTAEGTFLGLALHATNSKYYRIKNTNAATKLLGYDGVQTK